MTNYLFISNSSNFKIDNNIINQINSMLLNENATVTIAHSKTKHLVKSLKTYDLVVVAVGIPKFISANDLKARKNRL